MFIHRRLYCLLFLVLGFGAVQAEPLKFGVLLPAPPSLIHELFQPTADYLQAELGMPIEIVTPRSLEAVRNLTDKQHIDVLYINSYAYYLLARDNLLEATAQMKNVGGSIYSTGRIIVRQDSPIQSVGDLRGKRLALIGKLGAGAYLAPRAHLSSHNIDMEKEVDVFYTKNLKRSVYSVLHKDADAAAMCSINYSILSNKLDLGELRILDTTARFPESVIAVRSGLAAQLRTKITAAMIDMSGNEVGHAALKKLNRIKISAFTNYDPQVETIIEDLMVQGNM